VCRESPIIRLRDPISGEENKNLRCFARASVNEWTKKKPRKENPSCKRKESKEHKLLKKAGEGEAPGDRTAKIAPNPSSRVRKVGGKMRG